MALFGYRKTKTDEDPVEHENQDAWEPLGDPYRDPVATPRIDNSFGGLWTDRSDATDIADGLFDLASVSEKEHQDLLFWIEKGYVVLEQAVETELVDRLNRDIENVWTQGNPKAWVSAIENGSGVTRRLEPDDYTKTDNQIKLVDAYEYLVSAREAAFAPKIQRFLELVFQRAPMAHQSLSFYRGSKQPIHQDTAFVRISSPRELAASWIALEDIHPNTGELEYFEGSHRYPNFLFDGKYKWQPPGNEERGDFCEYLQACAKEHNTEATRFHPKKGDCLIWSADLAHGGSAYEDSSKTRKSLVTHYCPQSCHPMYFHYGRHSGKIRWRKNSHYCFMEKYEWRPGA